jgi:dipeptidyl-peptidase-4
MKPAATRLFVLSALSAARLLAQPAPPAAHPPADPARLTVDRLFGSEEFQTARLGPFVWSKRGASYFTLEAPPPGPGDHAGRDLVRHNLVDGGQEVVAPASAFLPRGAKKPLTVEAFTFSADESQVLIFTNSQRVWRRHTRGDYWVLDVATRELRQLGGDAPPATLMFAKFSPDRTRVAYVRANNLYVQDLRDLRVTALTTDGSATLINGTSDWVNEEELGLRDAFRWSPDGTAIAFWQFDTGDVGQFHLIDNTSALYPKITSFAYPKVGEKNSATRLGVIAATGGAVRWLEVPGDPREHYLPHLEWSPDGSQLLLQQLNRLQNTLRVMLADPPSGATRTIHTETAAAWVENENPVQWLDGGKAFLWLSERDGWRHAYVAGTDGARFTRITQGDFDVIDPEAVDTAGGWFYYAASPANPTQRYLYRTRLAGGAPERVSPAGQPGWHTYDVSPDAQWAVHTYSNFTTPPVVTLVHLPDHRVVRVLADNTKLREAIDALPQSATEFLRLEIGGGVTLDAWCIRPAKPDAQRKHPLLFYVYGEPASQSVRDIWGGKRGLWHRMLAQQGYVVVSVDNRGTASPRGREWRKVIYRQIGILAAQEQAAAANALLARWPFADPARVGIWGWSGGGSMSLNAIFRYPALYRTAIAVAPNASQLLYDTIYQERYMGLPADNVAGYRDGSPLTHAANLQGNLLLIHGTGDDNGHFQGTERLMNELIAHHKLFTVLPYPGRSHALSEGKNTERHFYTVLTDYLHKHLPPTN